MLAGPTPVISATRIENRRLIAASCGLNLRLLKAFWAPPLHPRLLMKPVGARVLVELPGSRSLSPAHRIPWVCTDPTTPMTGSMRLCMQLHIGHDPQVLLSYQ